MKSFSITRCGILLLSVAVLFGAVQPVSFSQSSLEQAVQTPEYKQTKEAFPPVRLLTNYEHQQKQGVDSRVGEIRADGNVISYDIGGLAGIYLEDTQKEKGEMKYFTEIAGKRVLINVSRDRVVLSFEANRPVNFMTDYDSRSDLIGFFLMVLTYSNESKISTKPIRSFTADLIAHVEAHIDTAYSSAKKKSVAQSNRFTDIPPYEKVRSWFRASKQGDRETIVSLLNSGIDINRKNVRHRTALHLACSNGNFAAAKTLIENGADIDARTDGGATPMMSATRGGHMRVFDLLIEAGADITARMNSGTTALHTASGRGHADMVQNLIEHGADVHARNDDGETALILASDQEQLNTVDVLLLNGADVNAQTKEGETALINAARWGTADMLSFLINAGADVNHANQAGETALIWSCRKNELEKVRTLLRHGARVDPRTKEGNTALMEAVENGASGARVVAQLLESGASVDLKNDRGKTALNMTHEVHMTQKLIHAGANINTRDKRGRTPLMRAARSRNIILANYLLESGARVQLKDKSGTTALMYAARAAKGERANPERVTRVVQVLLNHDANPDAQDENGKTALFYAAKYGVPEAVRCLIIAGAEPGLKTEDGESALTAARRNGHKKIESILKKYRQGTYLTDLYLQRTFSATDAERNRRMKTWIKRLGSGSADIRQKAKRQLISVGPDAMHLLKQNRNHQNEKIRKGVHRVISIIAGKQLKQEYLPVHELYLESNEVSDEAIKYLSDFPSLRVLKLGAKPLTGRGFERLSELTSLRSLYLRKKTSTFNNPSFQDGDSFGDGFGTSSDTSSSGNGFGSNENTEPEKIPGEGLAFLRDLSSLRTLILKEVRITHQDVKYLRSLTSLRTLQLPYSGLTDKKLNFLSALNDLRALNLKGNQIGDSGMKHLTSLQSLQTLHLGSTSITDNGLKHLERLRSLRRLNVTGTEVTSDAIESLRELQEERLRKQFVRQQFDPPSGGLKERIQRLIDQLGAYKFSTRQDAEKKLSALGQDAMYYLKRHRNHQNPEIANRVRKLIQQISASERTQFILKPSAIKSNSSDNSGFGDGDGGGFGSD